MKKKVFVTIFPEAENIHLVKDVGMIPYILYKNHNYLSYVACYNNGKYPYLVDEVKGLKIDFINNKFNSEFANVLFYILKNCKKIDIIHIFHFSIPKLVLCLIFKFLKFGKGKSYIKLDANDKILNSKYYGIKKFVVSKLIKSVNVISVETEKYKKYLNGDNQLGKQVTLIPNGYYPTITDFKYKEKVFLFVGRVGDPNKAVEILLDAFADFCIKDDSWTLNIIGEIELSFIEYKKTYLKNFSKIGAKINFIGPINNRKKLRDFFLEARYLIVPSYSEGFPLVFTEAINAKTIICASNNFASSFDVISNEKFGTTFMAGNSKDLSKKMTELAHKKICTDTQDYEIFREKFSWETIVSKINLQLNSQLS